MNISGNEKYNISHIETESKRLGSYELDPYQRYPKRAQRIESHRRVGRPKGSGKKKKKESNASEWFIPG
jgi:hypothetical protein